MKGQIIGAVLTIVIIVAVIIGLGVLFSVFRIDQGQGAIITHIGGNKEAVVSVGWHFLLPFLESYKKYPVVNDYLYFPSDLTLNGAGGAGVGVSGVEINAIDDTVVDVSAITYFDRTDLVQWGVNNVDPETQFDRAVSGIIRNVIQTSSAEDILHSRDAVAKKIFDTIKASGIEAQYGVRITSFSLQHTSYIDEVVKANAHKQALNLEAEGRLDASKKDADAIKITADAEAYKAKLLDAYSPTVLQYMQNIELYTVLKGRAGDVTWVIPAGMSSMPILQP